MITMKTSSNNFKRLLTILVVGILVLSIFVLILNNQSKAQSDTSKVTLTIKTLNWFPEDYQTAYVLQNELQSVGLNVQLDLEGSNLLYPQVYAQHNFTLYLNAWSNSPFPSQMFSFFQTWNDYTNGNNIYGFHNSTYDKLTNITEFNSNYTNFKEGLYEMQEIIQKNVVVIPLFTDQTLQLLSKNFKGYVPMPGGEFTPYDIWNILNMTPTTNSTNETFTIDFPSDVQTFNWFDTNNLRDYFVASLIYDSLVKFSPNMTIVPWLAQNYTISNDGLTYTFYLRNNVTFSNGMPLTAQDVAFTYDWALQNKAPYIYPYISMISNISVINNYTLKFVLSKPYIGLLYEMTEIPIVPEFQWVNQNITWANPNPIGSGPFILESRVPGTSLTFIANPHYWLKGYPKIKQLNIMIVPDETIRILNMEKGVADTELYSTPVDLALNATKNFPNQLQIVKSPGIWSVWLMFNLREYPTNDLHLRQAIAYAINRSEIVKNVLQGYGSPQYGPISSVWSPQFIPSNLTIYPYNTSLSKSILQEY
ncbi:MAG: ABC transporter substrate-binding protein, partial [Caldisphaera sp.]